MGIPLSEVKKFNVKGKVLVYKKDGEVVEMSLHKAQEYARPGATTAATSRPARRHLLRRRRLHGLDDHRAALEARRGALRRHGAPRALEVRSMDEFEQSMKVMIRLTKKQRERVPVPPGRTPRYVRPAGYPKVGADPDT